MARKPAKITPEQVHDLLFVQKLTIEDASSILDVCRSTLTRYLSVYKTRYPELFPEKIPVRSKKRSKLNSASKKAKTYHGPIMTQLIAQQVPESVLKSCSPDVIQSVVEALDKSFRNGRIYAEHGIGEKLFYEGYDPKRFIDEEFNQNVIEAIPVVEEICKTYMEKDLLMISPYRNQIMVIIKDRDDDLIRQIAPKLQRVRDCYLISTSPEYLILHFKRQTQGAKSYAKHYAR